MNRLFIIGTALTLMVFSFSSAVIDFSSAVDLNSTNLTKTKTILQITGGGDGGDGGYSEMNTDNGRTCGYPGTGNRSDYGWGGGVRG